jgi:transcriptional regulator with GAF, ATPase, and Fis domain
MARVASGTISILLLGETGAGKEVTARRIHQLSPRAGKPFVGINCAALPEPLLESELFGHERAAFTGATQAKAGLIETADGGTLFLDEVGEMPLTFQTKLLRVLEDREVLRVGSIRGRAVDVRFMAATNRDLEREIAAGLFRADLFYRLNGVSLTVPPLRERVADIRALALKFIASACGPLGRTEPNLSSAALEWLQRYDWPGNVRELRNCIERAVLLCEDTIELEHLPTDKTTRTLPDRFAHAAPAPVTIKPPPPPGSSDVDMAEDTLPGSYASEAERSLRQGAQGERDRILEALSLCAGNQTRAAKELGISRRTLVARLAEYRIPRPRKRV